MRIAQSSLVPGQSICRFVVDTFGFPFCQRLWDLTKRHCDGRHGVWHSGRHGVGHGGRHCNALRWTRWTTWWPTIKKCDINSFIEIQFSERVGHGGWLIGPKLFLPEAYPACAFSKFCDYIKWALFTFYIKLFTTQWWWWRLWWNESKHFLLNRLWSTHSIESFKFQERWDFIL